MPNLDPQQLDDSPVEPPIPDHPLICPVCGAMLPHAGARCPECQLQIPTDPGAAFRPPRGPIVKILAAVALLIIFAILIMMIDTAIHGFP